MGDHLCVARKTSGLTAGRPWGLLPSVRMTKARAAWAFRATHPISGRVTIERSFWPGAIGGHVDAVPTLGVAVREKLLGPHPENVGDGALGGLVRAGPDVLHARDAEAVTGKRQAS